MCDKLLGDICSGYYPYQLVVAVLLGRYLVCDSVCVRFYLI